MKRRNFLVGAGAAAIGGSALLGSGAFSEVNAQRSVTVQVAEDPNAYLGMDDCQDSNGNTTPNSSFASIDDDGHLQVDMTPSNPTNEGGAGDGAQGEGVNSESITWFDNVFQICNQGKEDVCLWISEKRGADPGRVTFYVDNDARTNTPTPERFIDDPLATREQVDVDDGIQGLNGVDNSIPLALGDCVCVGIEVYTREDDNFEIEKPSEGDQLLDGVTIVADVDEGDCFPGEETVCGVQGQFSCVSESDDSLIGHGVRFRNVGDIPVTQDLTYVILDSPDEESELTDANPLPTSPPGNFEPGDSKFPIAGVVAYVPPDDCEDVIVGELRDDWPGVDNGRTLPLPEDSDGTVRYDLLEGVTESRIDTIKAIDGWDSSATVQSLVDAFTDDTGTPPSVPADAVLSQIDYRGYDLKQINTDDISDGDTEEFESRVIDEFSTCD